MIISYEYYRVFYYVAKYRSFTQAANVLLGSQPNITRTVKNLESALGCSLFVRSNRSVTLTPEGEKLFKHISIAHDQIQAGEEELLSDRGLQSGIVSVSVSETALHNLLLPTLSRFHQAYPGVKLRISNHSVPQALTSLRNGLADFAVVTSPMELEKLLSERVLCPFREQLYCGSSMAFLQGIPLRLKDLTKYPFICLGRETITYAFYSNVFQSCGVPFAPDIEAATIDQILPMVRNNLGIGFLPEEFAKEALQKKEIFAIKLAEQLPQRSICLVERTDRTLSIAAGRLRQMLLESCGEDSAKRV